MSEIRLRLATVWVVGILVCATLGVLSYRARVYALTADDGVGARELVQEDKNTRDAFNKSLKRYPWYSEENDSARFLPQRPEKEKPVVRNEPPKRRPNVQRKPERGDGGVFWWLVSTFMLVILALVGWFCYRSLQLRATRRQFQLAEESRRKRRVETLADEAKDFYDDLKSAALAARTRGDFRSAAIFLFSWILVELDKLEFILLDKGKTNLEYRRELDGRQEEQAIYSVAMTEFERVYFGGQPITRDEFDARLYVLIAAFEKITARYDEMKRLQEAENGVNRRRPDDAAQFNASSAMILTVLLMCLSALGCGKEYWNDAYSTPAWIDYSKSLNSLSAFTEYCDSKIRGGLRSTQICTLDDPSVDTIIWLEPANAAASRHGVFVMVKNASVGGNSTKEIRDAYKANLERYANCVPERDWRDFYVPASNKTLYGTERSVAVHSLYMSNSDDGWNIIENWLKEKPNRVFVCVFDEWNASVEYWESALEDVKANAPGDKRELYLDECQTMITRAREARANARKDTLILRELLSVRRLAAIKALKRLNDSEKDFDFDDNEEPRLDGDLELGFDSAELFSPPDAETNGVDFGDDWASDSSAKFRRPYVNEVWCRSLFLDDDVKRDASPNAIFTGDPDWIAGLPPAPLREWTTLAPAEGTETLVALGGTPLICRRRVGKSQMIFINSTSILSNYALTESTNRILVERLVREFNSKGRAQLALSGLTQQSETRDANYSPGPFALTKASPYTFLVWHFVALAFFVAFAAWPILGRAKRLVAERNNNFGRHIGAMARLLKKMNAVVWTQDQLEAWRSSQRDRFGADENEDK